MLALGANSDGSIPILIESYEPAGNSLTGLKLIATDITLLLRQIPVLTFVTSFDGVNEPMTSLFYHKKHIDGNRSRSA